MVPDHSGQFDGVVLESRGRRYELERREDEFWVKMVDPDWDRERQARGLPPAERETAPVVERREQTGVTFELYPVKLVLN